MNAVPQIRSAGPDWAAIKQRQQATWASGDYAVIGTTLQIVGESLAEAADVRFQVADAEALPFDDGAFDVALSTFGAMFTPDHQATAREMLRVVRDGGRVGLANWTPDGFIGRLFKVIGAHVPPPAGVKSPALWGTEPHIVELFGPQAAQIRCERRHFHFRYRSPAHWLQVFRTFYGPAHKAFAALDEAGAKALEREIAVLLESMNTGGATSLVVPSEYLEVVVTKRSGAKGR